MTLPSFDNGWSNGSCTKPRIQVLEIRHRERPDGVPISWILVEREEIFHGGDSVHKATICLSYQQILPKYAQAANRKGSFVGSYSKPFNLVSLTSLSVGKGGVFLDLPGLEGHRIGTYLLNEIVTWAQQWPEAAVNQVSLIADQGLGDNKERRNRFYEQFGLRFDYCDATRREGRSLPMVVKELTTTKAWAQNITERKVDEYLAGLLLTEEKTAMELKLRTQLLAERNAELNEAESKPFRWFLKTLRF